jgi:hypothetical protein
MENKQKCCGNLFFILSIAASIVTTRIYEYLYNLRFNFISFNLSPAYLFSPFDEIRYAL